MDAAIALDICLETNVPVLLWGEPGTGKTKAIEARARARGWPCECLIAAIRDPADFGGYPVVADGELRFGAAPWARRLAAANGPALLFLDEISCAPPAVQAALLRVVLEGVVGDVVLPAGVRRVAAANEADIAAGGWDLAPPLANRFVHLAWNGLPMDEWAAGLAAGWPADAPLSVPADWRQTHAPTVQAAVLAFLRRRPTLLHDRPKEITAATRAWPSRRVWADMAIPLLACCAAARVGTEVEALVLGGAVGAGAAVEFLAWRREADIPDPEEVLAGRVPLPGPERLDRLYATLMGVASCVVASAPAKGAKAGHQRYRERWLAAWAVLGRVTDDALDSAVMAARVLGGVRPVATPIPQDARRFARVVQLVDGS